MRTGKHATILPRHAGFTLVELLIVIVVIAILAAITIVAYNGVTARAQTAKIQSDFSELSKAISIARNNTGQVMKDVTGSSYTASNCATLDPGVDISVVNSTTSSCWNAYNAALTNISTKSGINITGMKDPWGRPYFIDENEGESGRCTYDTLAVYANPLNGTNTTNPFSVPHSGYSGCSA